MGLKDWFNLGVLVGGLLFLLYIVVNLTLQLFTTLGIWDVRALGLSFVLIYSYLTFLKGIWELGTNKK